MLTKRLDIMISPEMASSLKEKAKLQKMTIGALVREGVKKIIGDVEIKKRISAVEELSKIKMNLPSWKKLKKQDHRGISDALETITEGKK